MKIRLFSLLAASMLSLTLITTVQAERAQTDEKRIKPIGIPSRIAGVLAIKASDVIKLADADEEIVIFDTRNATERKKGKIRWSEGLEHKQLTTQHLGKTLASKDTVVVFYGAKNSSVAANGAKFAASKGYKSVYWFSGGWSEWAKSGLRLDM